MPWPDYYTPTPDQIKANKKAFASMGFKSEPPICDAETASKYLLAFTKNMTSVRKICYYMPDIPMDMSHADTSGILRGKASQGDGVYFPFTPELKKAAAKALSELTKIGITIEKCERPITDLFKAHIRLADKTEKHIIFHSYPSVSKKSKMMGSDPRGPGGEMLELFYDAAGIRQQVSFIGIHQSVENPISSILHEIGHTFGLWHSPMALGDAPKCVFSPENYASQELMMKMHTEMMKHRCQVPWKDCDHSSIMHCAPHPNCYNDKQLLTEGDKLAFVAQYQKLTGRKATPAKSGKKKQHTELVLPSCRDDRNTCVVDMGEFTEGLRRRNITTIIDENESIPLDPSAISISEQPFYLNLTDESYKAFALAFSMTLAKQLIKYSRFSDITQDRLEIAIDFVITASIYSLPVAIFSAGAEKATEALVAYIKSQDSDKTWLIPYLKPLLPILLNTIYNFYLRKQLYQIIKEAGNMTLSLTINSLSGMLGSFMAELTAKGWHTLFTQKQKQE